MRHEWFARGDERCACCGDPECTGRIAVDFCPLWQEAQARTDRGEYLQTSADNNYYVRYQQEGL